MPTDTNGVRRTEFLLDLQGNLLSGTTATSERTLPPNQDSPPGVTEGMTSTAPVTAPGIRIEASSTYEDAFS
ncbi:MAG: hypothetical protein AAGA81_01345 [Acidobacteriota bacterium]